MITMLHFGIVHILLEHYPVYHYHSHFKSSAFFLLISKISVSVLYL